MQFSRAQKAKDFDKAYSDLNLAAQFLRDENLVWSRDFDNIRKPLAAWLGAEKMRGIHADPNAREIARQLLNEEFDVSS